MKESAEPVASEPPRHHRFEAGADALMPTVITLTLWLGCLTVGLIGFALPYPRPQSLPGKSEMPPVELLEVELSGALLVTPEQTAPPPTDLMEPPPLLDPLGPLEAPPLIPVAEPSPAIDFALPVEGPTRVVEARQASYARAQTQPMIAPTPPPVRALTYGQGEGRQPAPEYPRVAIRGGQEGTVTVRFSVGANGRVLSAEAASPCPWPLLNEAALRVIRDRWRFPSGDVRLYEVSIRFELNK